jgi:hypothetical protein
MKLLAESGIDWAHAWPYVGTGYVAAIGAVGGYAAWVIRKLRRAERTVPPGADEGAR